MMEKQELTNGRNELARLNELLKGGKTGIDIILEMVELLEKIGIKPKGYDLKPPFQNHFTSRITAIKIKDF